MKKTLFTLFSLLCLCREAGAFSVTHDFTVFIGPFNASQTSFTYALSPDSYAVASKVKTFGLFDTLYPFEARYATTGHIKNGKLETTSYKYQSQSRFTKRKKELIYNEQGVPVYRISSKNDKEKRLKSHPIPKTTKRPTFKLFLPNLPVNTIRLNSAIPAWRFSTANAALTLSSKTRVKKNWRPTSFRR